MIVIGWVNFMVSLPVPDLIKWIEDNEGEAAARPFLLFFFWSECVRRPGHIFEPFQMPKLGLPTRSLCYCNLNSADTVIMCLLQGTRVEKKTMFFSGGQTLRSDPLPSPLSGKNI